MEFLNYVKKLELKENDVKKIKKVLIKIILSILITMWVIGVIMMSVSFVKWILADNTRVIVAVSSLSTFVGFHLLKNLKIQ